MAEESKGIKKEYLWTIFPEFLCILVSGLFVFAYSRFHKYDMTVTLEYAVVGVFGICTAGAGVRRKLFLKEQTAFSLREYKNFWIFFAGCLLLSVICVFLPAECWPFVPVVILLSLFGDVSVGILSSMTLLFMPAVLTGNAAALLVYIPAGILAVSFFCPVEDGMKVTFPLGICMAGLLVLETAVFIIPQNTRPTWEMFLMPIVNIVISTILILGIVRAYSRRILYRYRDRYLEINDTGNPIMAGLKETDNERYRRSIHITHFCEIIAMKLKYDVDAMKTAGYYHVFGDEIKKIAEEKDFPPEAVRILEEYLLIKETPQKGSLRTKETAVLICSETVISAVMQLLDKDSDKKYDYDKVIDKIFEKFEEVDFFAECEIPVRDLRIVEKTFREGKLYYDFLR